MAQVLTQQEIDALLSSAGAAGAGHPASDVVADGKAPVLYDFKHPNRISKDQIRTLENIHSSFTGHLGSALTGMLRVVVDVDLVSVDQITYSEFIMSLVWPSCTYKFTMAPLDGQCIIDFSSVLAFAFVDRMFGGRGQGTKAERELTGIERRVLDIISARGLRELATAWKRIVEVDVTPCGFETTPQFIQVVPPGETVIVTTFQVKLLQVQGIVTVCYPYITLEPLAEKLSGQHWIDAARSRSSSGDRAILEDSLREVAGTVSATLATTEITMQDFLGLREGDVVVTDTRAGEPTTVRVGGIGKFTARPGMRGRRRAVQIIESITGSS